MMYRLVNCAALAGALIFSASAASAAGGGTNGTWRCSAQGNIPIGVLTVSGSAYKFQAVSNSQWAPKAVDSSNGSGNLTVGDRVLSVTSGPLFTSSMKVRSGKFGQATSPYHAPYDFISLFNDPKMAYVLMCYRPGAGS